jgi:hypothetical protein
VVRAQTRRLSLSCEGPEPDDIIDRYADD